MRWMNDFFHHFSLLLQLGQDELALDTPPSVGVGTPDVLEVVLAAEQPDERTVPRSVALPHRHLGFILTVFDDDIGFLMDNASSIHTESPAITLLHGSDES